MSVRSRIAVLVLSVVVGVVGAVLVLVWAERYADGEIGEAIDELGIERVLVTTSVIEAGTTLDEARLAGDVDFRDVARPAGDALVEILETDLELEFAHQAYPGDVVTRSRLTADAPSEPFPAQGDGRAAVTVTLGEAARGTAFLSAGARVAVLVTGLPAGDGAPGTRTCVLLGELDVLAVGGSTGTPGTDEPPPAGGVPDQLVTVDVDPGSALDLVQGDADGDLYFVRLGDGESPFVRGECRPSAELLTAGG